MKDCYNASTIKVASEGDHCTQHGLGLNRKGKEQAAKTIVGLINEIFKLTEKDPHEY